jgi:pyruvate formate lyase activating enzyme
VLKEGQKGICKVRKNQKGILFSLNYSRISSIHLDPVEKKPLYHFYPGKHILSVGSVGCNMKCNFCQNCEISQWETEDYSAIPMWEPSKLAKSAAENKESIGLAFTYNEPTVFFEFIKETAILSAEAGLKNAMISNGYINQEPLRNLLPVIHAFNIDLKGFSNDFYIKITHADLKPVLESLVLIRNSDRHLEITNLVIPGLNDNEKQFKAMLKWIRTNLGKETVLHLSRYFPRHRMKLPATSPESLQQLYLLAKSFLDYVYIGNAGDLTGQNTYCPHCNTLLIERQGYRTTLLGIDRNGHCSGCERRILMFL